jgi:transcriptional regulator with XRE-family HTH domain
MARVDLAKKAGISKAQLSQLLSSEANPTVKTFARIFHALGEKPTLRCAIESKEVALCPLEAATGEWRIEPDGTDILEPKRVRAKKAHIADLLRESIAASNDNQQRVLTMASDASSFELKAA